MKIDSKIIEIAKPDTVTSKFIEDAIKSIGLDFFHWAILSVDGDKLAINVNYVQY